MITLSIPHARLGQIFPAFLRVSVDGTILSRGPAIVRHVSAAVPGAALTAVFGNVPDLVQSACSGTTIHLHVPRPALHLSGSVLTEGDGFLLALNLMPGASLPSGGVVQIADFAPTDPAVPAMMLAGLQAALIEESKTIAVELAIERQRTMDLLGKVTAAAMRTAHELNNLVSIIGLNCHRLEREAASSAEALRLVDLIRETALSGAAITRAMMDLADRPEEPEHLGNVLADSPSGEDQAVRVLVVEDEAYALEALTELLGDMDYSVTACADAEAALAALGAARFDVLLTDVIMPGMSGIALARAAQWRDPAMGVVLMSGYLPEGLERRPEWLFLRKPLDLDRLHAILRQFAATGQR